MSTAAPPSKEKPPTLGQYVTGRLQNVSMRWLPFADLDSADLRLSRLIRLSLFQLTVGMVQTLFFGTLNRVMILELGVPATLVSVMIAIPLFIAPFRALVGFRSDTYRSVLGWRRVPFIWFGSMMQFSGLAMMPFALLVLSGTGVNQPPVWIAYVASGIAFFLVGLGSHTTQTAGLALATDVVPEEKRPKVIALMYVTMLIGNIASAFVIGGLLADYSPLRLIQVIQGTAVFTVFVNLVSLWKQEARRRGVKPYAKGERRPLFREAWQKFTEGGQAVRLLTAVAFGFFAFNLQDVLLEPYGGEILGLTVGQTTALTGIMALGAICSFGVGAAVLSRGIHPIRVAALGCAVGLMAFSMVIFASPLQSGELFRVGAFLIGFGEGLFAVGTLCTAMGLKDSEQHGIALGAWGAVFATSEGLALSSSGILKDWLSHLVTQGRLSPGLLDPSVPYSVVYHLEILALFATLVSLGPLVRAVGRERAEQAARKLEFTEMLA